MVLVEALLERSTEPITWIAVILGILTTYVISFYGKVRRLPQGPPALPVIGNILQLRSKVPLYEKALEWSRKYGDPFTVWIGNRPFIVASSKESFIDMSGPLRNLVAGRPESKFALAQTRGYQDVVFGDFAESWDVLRRLAHVAMRKFANTGALAELVKDRVDKAIDDVFETGNETPYVIVEYVEEIVNNILAVSSFGEAFKKGDPDYELMREADNRFEQEAPNGVPSDISPLLGIIFYKKERVIFDLMKNFHSVTDKMFGHAVATWKPGSSRHFTDTLLNAREEFLVESRESAKYLTDENLRQVVFDIFAAGTGTSRTVLSYNCAILANNPELQKELREEIMAEIGMNTCTKEDRSRLVKTNSFLQEVIRLYPPAPLSLPRTVLADVTINGRTIPKGTGVMMNVWARNRDKSVWGPDAEEFKPGRFIEITKEQQTRGFNSFGIGARSCPGEKLAQADLLYSLVRTLQRVELSCIDGPVTFDNQRSDLFVEAPHDKILFKKIA